MERRAAPPEAIRPQAALEVLLVLAGVPVGAVECGVVEWGISVKRSTICPW